MLADHKVEAEPAGGIERPTEIALIDTRDATQQLVDLPPRTSAESLVLSPKGHVEHALHVVDDGETTWLTVEPGTAPALAAWLDSMRFMLRVEVADRSAELATIGTFGEAPAVGDARLLAAATFGDVRLIDNVGVTVGGVAALEEEIAWTNATTTTTEGR